MAAQPNSAALLQKISQLIADDIAAKPAQVLAAIELLDGGDTVPFISRYRKEVTGGLDDTQLRKLEERLTYLRELEDRRTAVLKAIEEQGKLSAELAMAINAADSKQRLEDLYLPYKVKRRTKAQIAREAGLQPLAEQLLEQPDTTPESAAEAYTCEGFDDTRQVLDGARQILIERFAEDAELLANLRELAWERGIIDSKVAPGKEQEGAKFSDYFEYFEPINRIPSHRALALFRGRNESILWINLKLVDCENSGAPLAEQMIASRFGIKNQGRAADGWLADVVRWSWQVKLGLKIELDLLGKLREAAEAEAIRVFGHNLKDLLLAAPAGPRATLGLDPGLRTGVKVAVVDATGKLVDTGTIYPHAPRKQWNESLKSLAALVTKHDVSLIAIGNGTASRETDQLAGELLKLMNRAALQKVIVSEAGASIYSASELAAREFPELDVSIRGAVSIARRLQDPLAELVKIEPKAIGVGQYQHDVSQLQLSRSLDAIVEDCVNAVGVDLNTASAPLLARVAGLSAGAAEQVVQWRDTNGAFKTRQQLLEVPRLGPKTWQQCAGFLRIRNGEQPLDFSSVHPEAYPLVETIAGRAGRPLARLLGDKAFLGSLDPKMFITDQFGLPTIKDILAELEKPGRDPRPEFKTATFKDGVTELRDLQADMVLEGTVTNVTNFGAFVDIGVHQDGLVHISALSEQFVKDPHSVVKAGDVVKVKVMDVDLPRKRIALTMRLSDSAADQAGDKPSRKPADRAAGKKRTSGGRPAGQRVSGDRSAGKAATSKASPSSAMADALAQALSK